MKCHQLPLYVTAAYLTLAAPLAHCDVVVFSTIDPNATSYTFSGSGSSYPILNHPPGSGAGTYQSYADQFTPNTTFALSSISFAVRTFTGPTGIFGDLNAVIYTNNPGTNLPATALATSAAVAPTGNGSTQTLPSTLFDFSAAAFTFVAGQTYWIALEPGRDGTDVDWHGTTNNTTGRVAENINGSGYHLYSPGNISPTQPFGAFQIRAVPEPSTWALVLLGIGVTTRAYRRGNKPN